MAIEILEKAGWHAYFDAVSKVLQGKEAQIDVNALDVNALDVGTRLEAEFMPLPGIVYHPCNEILKVLVEVLDHTIANVREFFVDHDGMRLNSVNVVSSDGTQQFIRLRDPRCGLHRRRRRWHHIVKMVGGAYILGNTEQKRGFSGAGCLLQERLHV